jgi:hypothetical protein
MQGAKPQVIAKGALQIGGLSANSNRQDEVEPVVLLPAQGKKPLIDAHMELNGRDPTR